ncbi:MAG: hypothetical protein NT154_02940 [Verrucomicrobia bacterium]|nr:hypothetical protein [Verrucomicrobiota bacterium]
MSLINDALKRAKEAQQEAPPSLSAHPLLRPYEPAQPARPGLSLLVPAALAIVGLVGLFFVWRWTQPPELTRLRRPSVITPATASKDAAPQPALAVESPATPAPTLTTQSNKALRATSPPSPAAGPTATLTAEATTAKVSSPITTASESEATSAAIIPAAPPNTAPLRLQAIVFNPNRPSALISGKTLFIGDTLGAMRVVAIDRKSATLVSAGHTNVLSLRE